MKKTHCGSQKFLEQSGNEYVSWMVSVKGQVAEALLGQILLFVDEARSHIYGKILVRTLKF